MPLTNTQKQALATALRAETDQTVVDALAAGDTGTLAAWCNGASTVDAWMSAASRAALFEAMNITQYDGLTAGKRDAWTMLMDNAPIDFRKQKLRNAVVDVWGSANSVAVLTALLEKATRAEVYITPNVAGNQKTTNTVVGLDRNFVGQLSFLDVGEALRLF